MTRPFSVTELSAMLAAPPVVAAGLAAFAAAGAVSASTAASKIAPLSTETSRRRFRLSTSREHRVTANVAASCERNSGYNS